MSKPTGPGGARPGAGRPFSGRRQYAVRLDPALVVRLDETVAGLQPGVSRSDAIEAAILGWLQGIERKR